MENVDLDSFKAFLFDLDGTLADTMTLHNQAWIVTLAQFNCLMTSEILFEYAGVPNLKTVELFNERFGWDLDPVRIANLKEEAFLEQIDLLKPIASTVDIVKKYSKIKPMAIVSGGNEVLVELILNKLNLLDFFPVRVCAETTKRGKPFPDPFLFAAKELNVEPSHCLVFEDGKLGIEAAQKCGMRVVQVDDLFNLNALF